MTFSAERTVDLGAPFDLPRTLRPLQRGHADPAVRVDPGTFDGGSRGTAGAGAWVALRPTPDRTVAHAEDGDQAVLRLDQLDASRVRVRIIAASEPAAEAAVERAPELLGAADDWSELDELLAGSDAHIAQAMAAVRRRHPGVRLPATGALFDQLVTVTLEQKVTHGQARHGWRNLLRRHGSAPAHGWARHTPVPVPEWLRMPLTAGQLRSVPSWEWHRLWVQPPLSKTIQSIAQRSAALHRLGAQTPPGTEAVNALAERLASIPGIGVWSAAEALQRSHGAADLPAVGDYHLAHFVGEAMTGARTDDPGMIRLLEPYRPHRQRVVRLLKLSGFAHQRMGPKLAPEDHRSR
ncbi:DNA-3-methyladenine glycosylase [Nesterenkonia sp. NBAIMH1]|uniref:DNA-3-methyladenine glycosylase family protein n=1 Tax=Nesterenkonia sp. NBAIMH1 TaxID=2600320 RepID=UPI001FEFA067|nr:3-methyladenine DNA glycosylase [Nesterenkonia sp. NBAIMH1]